MLGTGNADAPNPARSIARTALATICNEAELLQRMCDGQAYNILQMSEELESLRRINSRQADTLARLQGPDRLWDNGFPTSLYAKLGVNSNNGLLNRVSELLKKEQELNGELKYKLPRSYLERLQREAGFGRKMAAVAGVNIA